MGLSAVGASCLRGRVAPAGACLVFRLWGTVDEKFLGAREGLRREARWCERSLFCHKDHFRNYARTCAFHHIYLF